MDSSLFDSRASTRTLPHSTKYQGVLEEAFATLSDAWGRGETLRVETLLAGIGAVNRSSLLELVYHEYCLADALGEKPVVAEYLARFPDLDPDLSRMIGLHSVLDDPRSFEIHPEEVPEPGDAIGPYHLVRELGKGGMARVFLAEQTDLDDRLVVLKVATRPSLEALLLARAQHPHIVPIIRQAHADGGGMHLIAMPFLGGHAFSAVLAEMARTGGRRAGTDLLAALDRVAAPEFTATETQSTVRQKIAGLPLAKAVAWMVARLAEALEHAGRLGVTHGDLKPANILIAADGRPMLLDFNLAVDWRSTDVELSGTAGGTLAYMAPERLRALSDPKSATMTRPADRQKADLYALGLVLREAISGRSPEVPRDCPWFREAASRLAQTREHVQPRAWCAVPGIPATLRPILARLLAPDPLDRYARMADLAEDLDLWVEDRPLHHARRSEGQGPRAVTWIKRRRLPLAVAAAVVAVAAIVALAATTHMNRRMRMQAEARLATLWDSGDPAIFRVRRFGQWRSNADEADISRRNLDHYAVLGNQDWRDREDVRSLGEPSRDDLEMWLMEQTWRLASALADRVDANDDWTRALALIERSPQWAALPPLERLRQRLCEQLERTYEPLGVRGAPAPGWLEAYALGLAAESQDLSLASRQYAKVLAEKPEAFWARYRSAVVAVRLRRYEEASRFLAACIASRPQNPALWTWRAVCLLGITPGKPIAVESCEDALRCCDRAVGLDPDFRDAYIVRCVARARLNLIDGQQADLARLNQLSQSQGRDLSLGVSLILDQISGRTGNTTAKAETIAVQVLIAEQLDLAGRFDEAIAAYDLVMMSEPDHLNARFARACLLYEQSRNESIHEFASLVEHPQFEELINANELALVSFSYLISHQLRRGDHREAKRLAERFLTLATKLRATDKVPSPLVAEACYAFARVVAQQIQTDPTAATHAAELLDRAGRLDAQLLEVRFVRDPFFQPDRDAIMRALRQLQAPRTPSSMNPMSRATAVQ